jgi:type IV pilus assembly protein PilQ
MKKRFRAVLICICFVVIATGFTRADDTAASSTASATQMVVASQPAAAPAVTSPTRSADAAPAAKPETKPTDVTAEPIVIDYSEADIQSVLRTLAAKAGLNLITGDEVTGKVTVHLENVSYEDAMRLVVESKGYAYIKSKNVVKVKSKESVEAEPVEVKLFTLNYAKADDVKKTLDPVLTKQGKIQVDTRSNTLVVLDTPSNLSKITPLIQSLDTQTPQVMIEAKFVETTKNPTKDLGINWKDTLLNHKLVAGSTAGTPDPITGEPKGNFQWEKNLAGGRWIPSTALLDAGQARLVFSFLGTDEDTELLANPRIVTTDNSKAKISISDQYPIPSFSFSEQTASLQISGFEYKDIGIILSVLPRINKNEFITLEVTPEASSTTKNQTISTGNNNVINIPIINTRIATTTVLIKSGHTLAIGGLMRQDTDNAYTRVPLMGDMPLIGSLFRSKSLNKKKRDLLIFLTPTIVSPESQAGYETSYNSLPPEKSHVDSKPIPKDSAKPRNMPKSSGRSAVQPQSSTPPTQNFGP